MSYQPPTNEPWQHQQPPSNTYYPPQQPLYQTGGLPPSPPPQPPKKKRGPLFWILVIGGIVIVVGLCQSMVKSASQSSTVTTPTQDTSQATTQPVQPTDTPVQTQAPKTIEQQINDLVQNAGLSGKNISSKYNVGGDNYEAVDEDIRDGNLTNSLTKGQIQNDCFLAQQALWKSNMASHISEVNVRVSGNVVDQYGNNSNQMIGSCDLKSATAKLFNWSKSGIDPKRWRLQSWILTHL